MIFWRYPAGKAGVFNNSNGFSYLRFSSSIGLQSNGS